MLPYSDHLARAAVPRVPYASTSASTARAAPRECKALAAHWSGPDNTARCSMGASEAEYTRWPDATRECVRLFCVSIFGSGTGTCLLFPLAIVSAYSTCVLVCFIQLSDFNSVYLIQSSTHVQSGCPRNHWQARGAEKNGFPLPVSTCGLCRVSTAC